LIKNYMTAMSYFIFKKGWSLELL